LSSFLRECDIPEDARAATLTLIGFLARRMPGEAASTVGVEQVAEQARHCAMLDEDPPPSAVKKSAAA
jgi:hypothetical protein